MEGRQRDNTQDWLLPGDSVPPSIEELEERIDEALTTAKEAEAAVESVGIAALEAAEHSREAAEQAARAAELAERANAVMREELASAKERQDSGSARREQAAGEVARSSEARPSVYVGHATQDAGRSASEGLRSFTERADRIVERLRQLERLPVMSGDTAH